MITFGNDWDIIYHLKQGSISAWGIISVCCLFSLTNPCIIPLQSLHSGSCLKTCKGSLQDHSSLSLHFVLKITASYRPTDWLQQNHLSRLGAHITSYISISTPTSIIWVVCTRVFHSTTHNSILNKVPSQRLTDMLHTDLLCLFYLSSTGVQSALSVNSTVQVSQ